MDFEVEGIPNEDQLYYRVHKSFIYDGNLMPVAFQERGEGVHRSMSTDWDKYSNPVETRERARIPEDNAVISLNVGAVRKLNLLVGHSPLEDPPNRAHTDVKPLGSSKSAKTNIRRRLMKIYAWELRLLA